MNIHRLYGAVSPYFRRRRMARFRAIMSPRKNERLLDVGGTSWIWENSGMPATITLLNRERAELRNTSLDEKHGIRHESVSGDGCALPYADASFDIVFSNSVIEHVGTWERQQAFAAEARRVGRRLWIQTPAREFFVEPHLMAPFVHWLPPSWQRRLIRNFTVHGWVTRPRSPEVDAFLREVRLLSFREMQILFPDCTIIRERWLGMTKSYVAVRATA